MSFRRITLPALAVLAVAGPALAQQHHRHRQRADAGPTAAPDEAGPAHAAAAVVPQGPRGQRQDQILVVVNGQPITERDVSDRGRLFALSTGLPMGGGVLDRLRPQITRQLIDERLRMQEIQQRHINVPPEQIAKSIEGIEGRNGMARNALRDRLGQDGVSLTTLIDQIRVQLAWSSVLRQQLGERARVSSADIRQRQDSLKRTSGEPEYELSEIFVPVEDPRNAADAQRFSDTVIQQLHEGAPFPIVAAQFSQSQTALDGGSLGWVRADTLDPQVVQVASQMPVGAVSNPIRVAGGYEIVTLAGRRQVGRQMTTVLSLRQAFLPFDTPLNPQAPTPQQQQALARVVALSKSAHDCDQIAAANRSFGEHRPSDPGSVQLDRLNPQMARVLAPLAVNEPSHPLVSGDGIDLIMVCSRSEKNLADLDTGQVADQLLSERVEMVSRQLNRDLHRRAVIDMRSS